VLPTSLWSHIQVFFSSRNCLFVVADCSNYTDKSNRQHPAAPGGKPAPPATRSPPSFTKSTSPFPRPRLNFQALGAPITRIRDFAQTILAGLIHFPVQEPRYTMRAENLPPLKKKTIDECLLTQITQVPPLRKVGTLNSSWRLYGGYARNNFRPKTIGAKTGSVANHIEPPVCGAPASVGLRTKSNGLFLSAEQLLGPFLNQAATDGQPNARLQKISIAA